MARDLRLVRIRWPILLVELCRFRQSFLPCSLTSPALTAKSGTTLNHLPRPGLVQPRSRRCSARYFLHLIPCPRLQSASDPKSSSTRLSSPHHPYNPIILGQQLKSARLMISTKSRPYSNSHSPSAETSYSSLLGLLLISHVQLTILETATSARPFLQYMSELGIPVPK